LISERWILTSAYCATVYKWVYPCLLTAHPEMNWIIDFVSSASIRPHLNSGKTKSILVYLGLHNRSSLSTEANAKMYEGKGLLVHSGWDLYTYDNNIALVYLATPVTFTRIIPILLIKYLLRDLFRLNLKTRNNF
jgi:hypothetical protein